MPPLISLFFIFSRFWAIAFANNQFSTIELMNNLFSSFSKYDRVFNSLFEPWENGTSMALVQTHTQVIKTREPMNMARPILEKPVYSNWISEFSFCFYWANEIALFTFFLIRLTFFCTFVMAVWASMVIPLTACELPFYIVSIMLSKSDQEAIWFVSNPSIWLSSWSCCWRVPSKFNSLFTKAGFEIMNFSICSGVLSLFIFMFLRNLFCTISERDILSSTEASRPRSKPLSISDYDSARPIAYYEGF